jgi:hypothetical protein
MATSKPQKLTRAQIKEGFDSIPVDVLLSSGKGKTPQLTTKQREFARQLVLAPSKAEAYRRSYDTKGKAVTQGNNASRLSKDSRIQAETEAYKLALEAEKHRTPAQLKALLVQQLVQHSLDDDFPPAQRVQCLKLLGSLFEVGAFIERKEITTVNKSADIRARLLSVLGSHAVDVEAKPAASADDGAASLLAELEEGPAPDEVAADDPNPTGAPPNGLGARESLTHTIPDIQSPEKSEPDFDAP